MKKFLLCGLVLFLFLITGCGKYGEKDVVRDLTKRIEGSRGYHLEGEMEIINNEDIYKYEVKVSFQDPELFRVSLRNIANNHEQIILKNQEGVYVLTPSLNKSFKFQSEWPYNNSQVYLLQALLKDIKDDNKKVFEETENYYVFTTKVNYPNNRKLTKQLVFVDKDLNFKEVHVLDSNSNPEIKMKFTKVDMKATFNNKYFALNENMTTASIDTKVVPVMKMDNIVYPMFIPENTYLTSQNIITKTKGERVILTFGGDNPFILVEETAEIEEDFTIIPTYGDPILLTDTIGYITDNSISWSSGGMEYFIASDVMAKSDLIEIAKSVGVMPVGK
jgi:outer membrane lipoprotein-sorting protein